MLKKSILLIILFCICIILVACNSGKVNNAEIIIGHSNKFSEGEIKEAIYIVQDKFKDFRGCNLTKIWYDEEKCNESENTILLLSNFKTGKSSISQGFNPNSNYDNWMWILTRESRDQNWEIIGWGY